MNEILLRLLCLAIGYGFGLFQTAYILGKARGIDIRQHGSGNSGTTNALRVLGTKDGLIVFAGDMLKSLFAILLTSFLFGNRYPELVWVLKMYTFAGTVLGHDFPFYMGFKGGKGVAVVAGFCFAYHIAFVPVQAALFLIPFLLTKFVSLGSLCVYGAVLIQLIVMGQAGVFGPLPQAMLTEMYVIMGLLTALAYYRHRANIVRLTTGTERKTYLFGKHGEEENRRES